MTTMITATDEAGEVIYSGSSKTEFRKCIKSFCPVGKTISFRVLDNNYASFIDVSNAINKLPSVDITIIIQELNTCLGRVVVDCRYGGSRCDTIARYYTESCKNFVHGSVCKECRGATTNLILATCRKYNLRESIQNNDPDTDVIIVPQDKETILKIFDFTQSHLDLMTDDRRRKYLKNLEEKYKYTKYDFCRRNPPWW